MTRYIAKRAYCPHCGHETPYMAQHTARCFDNPAVQKRLRRWMAEHATATTDAEGVRRVHGCSRDYYDAHAPKDLPALCTLTGVVFDGWLEFIQWCGFDLTQKQAAQQHARIAARHARLRGRGDDPLEGASVLHICAVRYVGDMAYMLVR